MPRQSAAVYRRRRLVLFVALLVLLTVIGVGVWLLIAQPWAQGADKPKPTASSGETPTPTGEGTASPTAVPSPDETPGVTACAAKDIVVAAVADADSYEPGVLPKLSISLTNNGSADCTLDVGSATQKFTVASGDDVWWRSTDCQENPSSMVATLTAGATVVSKEPVVWDRTRSSVETCAQENRPRAPGGGASYHVSVEIGGFPAAETKQILLF
ncbi:hypothetical protein [Streptomyces sp. AC495_CC817]|uniref:hypothetical protein n=1 Tax=Streptomyces sp. AC495_CC817 TaxID=2823900 RepID=UPI001C251435|nr:hypothetical protein [Streptomyces sp. AC495_CC817]